MLVLFCSDKSLDNLFAGIKVVVFWDFFNFLEKKINGLKKLHSQVQDFPVFPT